MNDAPFTSLPIYTAAITTTSPSPPPPPTTTTSTPHIPKPTCFRILCHSSRAGGIIGKSGSIIKHLQTATSSKIRLLESNPSSEFRVISISADSTLTKTMSFCNGYENSYNNNNNNNDNSNDDIYMNVSISNAQEGLVRVYERILNVAADENDDDYETNENVDDNCVVSCRLLADTNNVGFLIGKSGKGIEKIRKEANCKIRIFSQGRLPSCALPNDELIEIEGDILAVKKALIAISGRLQECPLSEKETTVLDRPNNRFNREHTLPNGYNRKPALSNGYNRKPASSNGYNLEPGLRNGYNHEPALENGYRQEAALRNGYNYEHALTNGHMDLAQARTSNEEPAPRNSSSYALGTKRFGSLKAEAFPSVDFRHSQDLHEIVFRILCSSDRVGGVIGNSGTIVRALENESGARIRISPPAEYHYEERLITITAMESSESRNSPAQNGVILVFNRSVEAGYEKGLDLPSSGTHITAKLVIPANHMGCLLGKRGSIIADMRKVTGAYIKIVGGEEGPRFVPETDQIVLITGELTNVRDALYSVTRRLRNFIFFCKKSSGPNISGAYGHGSGQPPFRMHPSIATDQFNQHTSLMQSMDNLTLSNVDHPSSSRPPQPRAGDRNPMDGHDVDRGSTSYKGGIELGRGNRSAIVTNTTVEIMIPENDIGLIYGENGSNLTRLRQISGAKVEIHEAGSGLNNQIIVISGTPDETQSAQTLLQAFILADQQ
uniref:KH domain-containing protein HEN4-like n=1 Tax=Erigeron canadensis TaxID=72917 RepID=UPI001CB8D3FF|nr:KH domain-containing protein HEN4-like [Erigeron canadensis]